MAAEMDKLDRRVREALSATKQRKRDEEPFVAGSPAKVWRSPPSAGVSKLLAEQLGRIGIDAEALKRERAAGRAESERQLTTLKEDAVANSGGRAESVGHVLDDFAVSFDDLVVSPGEATTQYQTLDSPLQIWADDGIDLESSSIQPYHSQAKVRMEASYYTSFFGAYLAGEERLLHFQYLWGNPRQDASAVLSVNAVLALNGFCWAQSEGGITGGGSALLDLEPTVDLVQTWTQPISSVPPQPAQSYRVARIDADSSGLFSDDQTTYAVVYRGVAVGCEQVIVPPGQYLIIDVALRFYSSTIDGKVNADFATGLFSVLSPYVALVIVFP